MLKRLTASLSNAEQRWMAALIGLGCLLRWVWPEDMKWKADEIWMYATARSIADGHSPWPLLGMGNGVGFANPGLSVWSFVGLAQLSSGPVGMVRWVQGANILAILLFVGFVRRYIAPAERRIWLWGLTIASVNPLAIHFSRAIWSSDLLPLIGFVVFVGHWWRGRFWGAWVWGCVGTLIGQVHMSGFFWQGGLVLWTLGQELRSRFSPRSQSQFLPPARLPARSQPSQSRTHWWGWGLGTIAGMIPMLPWIQQVATTAATIQRPSWAELLTPNFHLHWLLSAWGLNLEYEFSQLFWRGVLPQPLWFGQPSFGMLMGHLILLGSALMALWLWWQRRSSQATADLGVDLGAAAPPQWLVFDYFWVGAVVMPLLLLAARVRIPAHYLVTLFPFPFIWAAWLMRSRTRWLILVCSVQLILAAYFLLYVHRHGGIPDADYGVAYRWHPLKFD
jgi:hypothetical protein